jgi:hypothetical protein
MLDLEHLDALDDDTPPEPDLASARVRARRLRARHRWTAVAAAVVVLGGAAVAVAALHGDDHSVQVVGPSGTTSVPFTPQVHPTSSGTLPNGIHVELTLTTPTVTLGSDIRATVVLRNDTAEAKTLGTDPIQCAVDLGAVLRDATGNVVVNDANGGIGCYDIGIGLAPGKTRTLAVVVPTSALQIPTGQRNAQYELTLQRTAGLQPAWSLPPVPVEVAVPEGLSARLELPKTTYPAGYSLEGTIVFVNGTGRPVDYHIDCQRTPPWEVVLSKDGVLFFVPQAAVGCAANSGTTAHLAPGTTRLPFYVNLGYPECSGSGPTGPAAPRCTGSPPGIPDLAPGRYQIVFRGTDAPFQSLDVPPLAVDVTARSGAAP